MSTTIEVNKQSVKQLLESGKEKLFVIPEYQRPYAWSNDQIITLFQDLWEFTEARVDSDNPHSGKTYFLGSVVSFVNESNEQEIIDGQQRITSLFLLLRAIYTHIVSEETLTKEAENFKNKIEDAIWLTNNLTGEVDFDSVLLESRVLSNEGNEILRNILKTGNYDPKAKDPYSLNYKLFNELFDEAAQTKPFLLYEFIYTVLNCGILLPITADSQDTALTIFSTLNDRGLQLSDADIFKAKIYNNLDKEGKNEFIYKWKQLENNSEEWQESVQSLFYYYMFYLRALEGDTKTTTPGLRNFFARDRFKQLYKDNLMDNLAVVLELWRVVNMHKSIDGISWTEDSTIMRLLDTLSSYSNEFWKYPVVVYYLCHRNNEDFPETFKLFLQKLANELITNFLEAPTINAVKPSILKLNAAIIKSNRPRFEFKDIDNDNLAERIARPHNKAVRMLLKILAYNNQEDLLPAKWEIEHILPTKYQNSYFLEDNDDVIREKIEHLGNKLPIEKKLNITASNDYFERKKEIYINSGVAIVRDMANFPGSNWKIDEIIHRDAIVSQEIIAVLKKWDDDYFCDEPLQKEKEKEGPTPEQQAFLEQAKEKGWI